MICILSVSLKVKDPGIITVYFFKVERPARWLVYSKYLFIPEKRSVPTPCTENV